MKLVFGRSRSTVLVEQSGCTAECCWWSHGIFKQIHTTGWGECHGVVSVVLCADGEDDGVSEGCRDQAVVQVCFILDLVKKGCSQGVIRMMTLQGHLSRR